MSEVNPKIKEVLRDNNILINDGLSVLIIMYHGLKPSFLPQDLITKVLETGIVSLDYATRTLDWKVGLYEKQETNYDWVTEWMDLFKKVNPERRGSKPAVVKRMKDFFANNPSYNVQNVMSATKSYLQGINDSRYVKTSHKFIKEIDGSSLLLEHLERTQVQGRENRTFNDLI